LGLVNGHPLGSSSGFALHAAIETFDPYDGALVETAGDEFVLVPSLDLKSHRTILGVDHSSSASDALALKRGRQVPQFDFRTNRSLIRFEKRNQGLARRAFQQTDQPGGAQDWRHSIAGKINDVLRFDDELQLANGANTGR